MPTPDRTSLDEIVRAARELLEDSGLASLTMSAVAQRVGVRAPSLYKRVRDRDALIQLVAEATLSELAERLDRGTTVADLADEFRAFGHERPAAFALVMTPGAGTPVAGDQFRVAATTGILRVAGELAGQDHALQAARTFTAWAAGFVSMELNGAFGLGGSVDDAWSFGVETIARAMRS